MQVSLKELESLKEDPDRLELKNDALDFFHQNHTYKKPVRGNMGKWGYGSPKHKDDPVRGDALWDLFVVLHQPYYPKRSQQKLIHERLSWLHALTGDVDIIVDFGCGGDESIQEQAIPLLQEYAKASTYVPVDLCVSYLDGAVSQVEKKFKGQKKVVPIEADLTKTVLNVPSGKKLGLFLGASTNFEEFPNGMETLLTTFRQAVGEDGYLAMCIDTNLERTSVHKSYDHRIHHEQEINLLYRLKRDLNISGDLDPSSWQYETDTEELEFFGHKVLLTSHVLVATRAQSFFIDDEHIAIAKGERLVADKSYKIPVALMDILANKMGFIPIASVHDDQNRMALALYQGVKTFSPCISDGFTP